MKLKVLDLFSGIGGFSLGLERAISDGPYTGFETVAFCEIEPFPRKVLAKHWPEVPQYEDVRTLTAERLAADGIAVDVITGGFPCQDISVAGKQAGLGEGTRSGLWSECLRLTSELRPRYAIFENVSNLLSGPSGKPGAWFSRILADLAIVGYDAEWENIPASAVGAPHRRERVWIVAHPSELRREEVLNYTKKKFIKENISWTPLFLGTRNLDIRKFRDMLSEPALFSSDDGFPERVAGLIACGNAVVPQIPELIGNAILESMK
jgi:DNA (cytosine-5)-methyltransferase 1